MAQHDPARPLGVSRKKREEGDASNPGTPSSERPRTSGPESAGSPRSPRAADWIQSPYLAGVAARVARSKGLAPEDVPDLLQEIRIALWRAGSETRVGPSWLFQVANHKAVDFLRRRVRMREIEREFMTAADPPAGDSELGHLLHAQASRLPARLSEFYDLHYGQGLSEREIAARLGVCRQSVRWLDRRCRLGIAGRARPNLPR
ncbi:MAG: sigma-70 family RNA polymerase sigma factor [Acidobacteriota bacterium]|nr:sigma-70 family RNA polymerase sigma factor [Acidobacteriota bacterium]